MIPEQRNWPAAITNPELRNEITANLHNQNPEWDFMFRTYSVLAFANLAMHEPQQQKLYLDTIDLIINDTLALETRHGFDYFLLPYSNNGRWIIQPPKSLFIDGEIALMLAVRSVIENKIEYNIELNRRVDLITERMEKNSLYCMESYPDEYWLFCNSIALAAVRISDLLNHTDHSKLISKWLESAKNKLIDSETGVLCSAFDMHGNPADAAGGPEGSSIWMSCQMLQIIDKTFAESQYSKAKNALLGNIFGLGYSREWPANNPVNTDIDSGEIVPIINASPSASGLAIIAAASFKDKKSFNNITRTLYLFASPVETDDSLYFKSGNALGDVVILYGLSVGPLWDKVISANN